MYKYAAMCNDLLIIINNDLLPVVASSIRNPKIKKIFLHFPAEKVMSQILLVFNL